MAHTLTHRAASRLKKGAAGWLLGSHTHTQRATSRLKEAEAIRIKGGAAASRLLGSQRGNSRFAPSFTQREASMRVGSRREHQVGSWAHTESSIYRLNEGAAGRLLGSFREQQVGSKREQQVSSLADTLTQRAASRLKEEAAD